MNAPPSSPRYAPFPPGSPFATTVSAKGAAEGAETPRELRPLAPSRMGSASAPRAAGVAPDAVMWQRTAYRGEIPAPRAPRPTAPVRPRELVALVAFVVGADLLLYTFGGLGLSQAAFFGLAGALVVASARERRISPRMAVTLGLLALVAGHLAWSGGGVGSVLAAALVGALAVLVRMRHATVADAVASMAASVWAMPGRVASVARGGMRLTAPSRHGAARAPFAWSTVVLPVVAFLVFASVFVFANPVLEAWAVRALGSISLPSPVRPLFWLVAAACGAVTLRPALRRAWQSTLGRRSHAAVDDTSLVSEKALGLARNTLVAVNAIFLLENAVDALSLWAGRPPAGLGYTEYAHRGTAWLTFALVLSTALLGAIFRGAFHFDSRAKTVRALAYVWAAQNVMLALGTFRRIQLYIDLSGLTSLRILGILGTTLVATGFCLVVVMIRKKRTIGWLMHRKLDALVVASVLYVVAPTELLSTEWNQRRLFDGQYAPLLNVVANSHADENVPALVKLLAHPDPIVQKGTAALLASRPTPDTATLAGVMAERALDAHKSELATLSPPSDRSNDLAALWKLAGVANEDEASFDYRGRGGVRSGSF
ncbi:MAG: DUF4153 domain-containing protein [Polyangiaceae bacterium]